MEHNEIFKVNDTTDYSKLVDELIDAIHSEFEKRMIEGFECHGYSKAWLCDPRNTERVVMTDLMTEDGVIKSFSVDGKEIFKIAQCMETDVDPVLGPCVSKMVLKIYGSESL